MICTDSFRYRGQFSGNRCHHISRKKSNGYNKFKGRTNIQSDIRCTKNTRINFQNKAAIRCLPGMYLIVHYIGRSLFILHYVKDEIEKAPSNDICKSLRISSKLIGHINLIDNCLDVRRLHDLSLI